MSAYISRLTAIVGRSQDQREELKQKPCRTLIICFLSHLSFTAKAQEPMDAVTHSWLGLPTSSSTENPPLTDLAKSQSDPGNQFLD